MFFAVWRRSQKLQLFMSAQITKGPERPAAREKTGKNKERKISVKKERKERTLKEKNCVHQ